MCGTYKPLYIDLNTYLDMMFLFKLSKLWCYKSSEISPSYTQNLNARTTRSVQPNCLQFRTKKCYTATYQQSYTIRSTRIWNTLPKLITNKSNSLYTFKKYLLDYYLSALQLNYNIDDPRSWKTICLKCNQTRDLTKPLACCF